jgi:CRP/FNR family transcriptional regulator
MELLEILSKDPIFKHLNNQELKQIGEYAIQRKYRSGQTITYYGDTWPYLFVIIKGSVIGIKESKEGRSLIVVSLGTRDVFWGTAFFEEEASMPVSLISEGESYLALWSKEVLHPVLLRNGSMSWELARLMVKRMQLASEIVEGLAFQPVVGRLANLLLENYGDSVGEYVSRDLTLDEMGSRIGTTREMVCRVLARFAEEETIRIERTKFMIMDREKLKEYTELEKG